MSINTDLNKTVGAQTTVYVVGEKGNPLPSELNTLIKSIPFCNQYYQTKDYRIGYVQQNTSKDIQFLYYPSGFFTRVRSMCFSPAFNVPNYIGDPIGTNGRCAITPLFGMGVTYWDSVDLGLGVTSKKIISNADQIHWMYMMKYISFINRNPENFKLWWEQAGFFDYDSFDYCSGVVTTNVVANSIPCPRDDNVTWSGNSVLYQSSVNAGTQFCSGLFCPPEGVGFWPGGGNPCTNNGNTYPVRQMECGFWLDEGLQRMRSIFYGNGDCTNTRYNVKLSLLTDVGDTFLCYPPVQWNLKFNYNNPNSVRPRYVNTVATDVTTNPNSSFAIEILDQPTFKGFTVTPNLCWLFVTNVQFRPDIQGVFLSTWQTGYGFMDIIVQPSLYQHNLHNITQTTINVVHPNNNVPYMIAMGFTDTWPLQGLKYGTYCPQNQIMPWAFTDVHLNHIRFELMTVCPNNIDHYFYRDQMPPESWYQNATEGSLNRGVWDPETTWHQIGFYTQYFMDSSFDDMNHQPFRNDWKQINMPPQGYHNFGAQAYMPGARAAILNGSNYAWFSGKHTQLFAQFLAPSGFNDSNADYGIYQGSLRLQLDFRDSVVTPIMMYILQYSKEALTVLGNNQATSNLIGP